MARLRIIGINYAPESTGIAPYTTGLAEHLAASGHEVTVVTGLPHYPAWRIAPATEAAWRARGAPGGVRLRRRAHYVPATQTAMQRAIYEGTFLVSALPAATEGGVDAVIGIVPSLSGGILARLAATRNRVPYGLLFQDLMGPAAAQSGIAGGGRVAGLTRAGRGVGGRSGDGRGDRQRRLPAVSRRTWESRTNGSTSCPTGRTSPRRRWTARRLAESSAGTMGARSSSMPATWAPSKGSSRSSRPPGWPTIAASRFASCSWAPAISAPTSWLRVPASARSNSPIPFRRPGSRTSWQPRTCSCCRSERRSSTCRCPAS